MIILSTNICEIPLVLKILKFILALLNIVRFIVPMILIIMVSIDFFKNVITSNGDNMKKNVNISIRRILMAVALFLIPNIVDISLSVVETSSNGTLSTYNECKSNIKDIKTIEKKYEMDHHTDYNVTIESKKQKAFKILAYNPSGSSSSSDSSTTGGAGAWKYYNQADGWGNNCTSKTMKSSGCGLTSFAVIANALSGKSVTPATVRDYMCKNGHSGGAMAYSWFTKASFLNKYNLTSTPLFDHGYNGTKTYSEKEATQILNAVKNGNGVVMLVPGHYVALGPGKNCGTDQVYLYDVGKRANNGCYTMKNLWNKVKNYKNRCNSNGRCGWIKAWELKRK